MEKNNRRDADYTIFGDTPIAQHLIDKVVEDSQELITIKVRMGTTPGQIMVVGAVNKKADLLFKLAGGAEYYDGWLRRLNDAVNSAATPLADLASEMIYKSLEKFVAGSESENAENAGR